MISLIDPILFGFGYGLGGAFPYAKQVAAVAAGVAYPREALPSDSLISPAPCGGSPETPHGVAQKRINIHPMSQAALRQGFEGL